MREIKFRAFNEETKEMINVYGAWFEEQGQYHEEDFSKIGTEILMQYTGLKDKNGVEIYEGDVVRDCEVNWNGVVKWEQYGLGSWRIKNDVTEDMMFDAHCLEVIGNIHENPKLIKGKK